MRDMNDGEVHHSSDHGFDAEFTSILMDTTRSNELLARLTSQGAPAKVSPFTSLEDGWERYWDKRLSSLVQEQIPNSANSEQLGAPGQTVFSPVRDTPGVALRELAVNRYRFSPLPVDLLRKSRRWWKKFDLEAMIEDRLYADYRDSLNKEGTALVDAALDTKKDCTEAIEGINEIKKALANRHEAGFRNLKSSFEDLGLALEGTLEICEAILRVFQDQKFRVAFYEAVRSLHADIQHAWGTWSRRVRDPLYLALAVLVFAAVILHPLIGFLSGARSALPLLMLLPAAVFLSTYYAGRAKCQRMIDAVVARVAVFNPEPDESRRAAIDSGVRRRSEGSWFGSKSASDVPTLTRAVEFLLLHENTIWNPGQSKRKAKTSLKAAELANGAYSLTVSLAGLGGRMDWTGFVAQTGAELKEGGEGTLCASELAKRYTSEGQGAFGRAGRRRKTLVWATAGVTLCVLVVLFLAGGDRKVDVGAMGPSGLCRLTSGYIVWPGPGDVLVLMPLEEPSWLRFQLTSVPASHVASIASHRQSLAPCDAVVRSDGGTSGIVPSTMNFYQQGVARERMALNVPFAAQRASSSRSSDPEISCDLGPAQVLLSPEMSSMLRRLGDGLRACGHRPGGPSVIDVRGFASSVRFKGSCAPQSDAKNLELAELRRNRVLHAMFGKGKFVGDYPPSWHWEADGVIVRPDGPKRFESMDHLLDLSAMRDDGLSDRYLTQRVEVLVLSTGGCEATSLLEVQKPS